MRLRESCSWRISQGASPPRRVSEVPASLREPEGTAEVPRRWENKV